MSERLKGKVAVITGSGTGIGKVLALAMAKEGAKVVTNNRKPGTTALPSYSKDFTQTLTTKEKEQTARVVQDAESTAKEIKAMGGQAVAFFGDVGDFEVARNLIKTTLDNFGKVDIMVNNAGTYQMSPIWEMSLEVWHRVVDSHLQGTWNCTRHVAGLMKEQKWGRIINATSGAWLGQMNGVNYSSAKGGVVSLTYAAARDLWPYGITVNSYAPGTMTRALRSVINWTKKMAEATGRTISKEQMAQTENMINIPGPETIVPFIVYLATEEAAQISGTVFSLSGNLIGRYSEPEVVATLDKKEGLWTVDELAKKVPGALLKGYKTKATN